MTSADAIAIRHARRKRVRMIRRRVTCAMLALFVATWLLITVLLVTGHDPALARQASAAQTTGTNSGSASSSSSSTSSSTGFGATSSNTGGGSSSVTTGSSGSGLSSVTSSQS